ncbi:unnamed protein product [Phytomonas sp. Hart1]|nr:unnamed protein product [Phytomonas sp. Hart1]|eukprot:CCW70796.1 unnamed protein product [Phytomonas sp. isolate Hart1]
MSFTTKLSMWWGSVVTGTESLFGKKKKRIITHEYYIGTPPMPQFCMDVPPDVLGEYNVLQYADGTQDVEQESIVPMNSSVIQREHV